MRVIIESLSHRRQPKTLRDKNQERFGILPVYRVWGSTTIPLKRETAILEMSGDIRSSI